MNDLFVYADRNAVERLRGDEPKVILIGSNAGHSNFGDVLQLKQTVEFHQGTTSLMPIPVFALDMVSGPRFIDFMQRHYGVETILFVSERALDVASLNMDLVGEIANVAAVHLYGGGFLNGMWGPYVLDIAEHFLRKVPGVAYAVSGQQIGAEIRDRLMTHINEFKPKHFGVRDFDSLELITGWGEKCTYSFDDAYEPLIKLASQIPANKGNRVIGHLNLSSYTSENFNERADRVLNIFGRMRAALPCHQLTLVNAYNDKRFEVCDSLASVVRLENDFPYKRFEVLDLSMAAHSGVIDAPESLAGQLGISCSYHITMLLHLAGIPCWLLSQNSFYEQKARALNGGGDFEVFMRNLQVPDYSRRIAARASWRETLAAFFQGSSRSSVDLHFQNRVQPVNLATVRYKTNGVENLCESIQWLEQQVNSKDAYIAELLSAKEWYEGQIGSMDSYIAELLSTKQLLEGQVVAKDAYITELSSAKGWLKAQIQRK